MPILMCRARVSACERPALEFRNCAQFDENVRTSAQVVDARRNLEDARIANLATDAYFWATLDASKVALDYAYYMHRYDYYKYASYGYYGYNTYPYGGGYRGGYPVGYPYSWMR